MTLPLLLGLWLAWVGLGVAAELRARRRLAAVPQRILVSGGRGKTTLVRLIHAGLLASGRTAVGRISGDQPMLVGSDGSEQAEQRWGPASIRELRRLGRLIKGSGVELMVVENMAIDPELQAVVAQRLVRPTLAVMAPDALDHLEVLPADQDERTRLQLATLPAGTPVILPGASSEQSLVRCAGELSLDWQVAPTHTTDGLRPFMSILAGMALEAIRQSCEEISAAARDAILAAAKQLQTITVYRRARTAWVDGLSANDPFAAQELSATASGEARRRGYTTRARLLNHRSDRPSRMPLFAPLLDGEPAWVVGAPYPRALAAGVSAARLSGTPAQIVAIIEDSLAESGESAFVLCLGNSAGTGQVLRRWLATHSEVESW